MAFDYINEAFKKLDLLEEQMFDTSLKGINELSDFMDADNTDDIVRVIDPEAETEESIQDSYVGKVIVNCNVCHSHVFENKEDVKIEEDGTVNVETQCPYCSESEGFTIIGEIAPFGGKVEEDKPEEGTETPVEEPAESEEDTNLDESYDEDKDANISVMASKATRRAAAIQEDFKEVSIKTEDQKLEMSSDENGKVTVTTEPIADDEAGETIVPVSAETESEILDNNAENIEEPVEELPEEEFDFDFDEVDEDSMNELGENYLRRVYENVESFRTSSVAANESNLIVEGVIKFSSGAEKKTGFVFEAKDANKRGQLRFVGSNKHLTEAKDAFSLVAVVDNKKLFAESLKYNYKVNDNAVRGIVRRK